MASLVSSFNVIKINTSAEKLKKNTQEVVKETENKKNTKKNIVDPRYEIKKEKDRTVYSFEGVDKYYRKKLQCGL